MWTLVIPITFLCILSGPFKICDKRAGDEWINTVGKNDLKKRDFSKTLFILTLDRGPSLKDRGIQKSVSE